MYVKKRAAAWAALAALAVLASPVWKAASAKAVDLTQKCSLTITPQESSAEEERPDLAVDLYLVAKAEAVKGYDAYTLVPEEEYEALELEDLMYGSGEEEDAEKYWILAEEAARTALGIQDGEPVSSAGAFLAAATTDLSVEDEITDLEAGLYLMVVRGADLTEAGDYVMALSGGEIATVAYDDGYLYKYSPQLIALPQRKPQAGGGWDPDVAVQLKSEKSERYASLRIEKSISPAAGVKRLTGEDHFVYQIEATFGGRNIYSNVVMLTMPPDGVKEEMVLKEIVPVGSRITVTEVYTGASYELAGDREVIIDHAAGDDGDGIHNAAAFTNRYTGTDIGGGGVENHFTNEDGTWTWQPLTDHEAQ